MRDRIDVPSLLDRLGIDARSKGRAYVAACPMPGHDEREPSWSMRDDPDDDRHGLHHCFGCGRGGTPADLVAAMLGVELSEAIEWIRSKGVLHGGSLPERIVVRVLRDRVPYRLPQGVVFSPFEEWPVAAREYLLSRRVTEDQVARWGLGYAATGRLAMRVVIPVRDCGGAIRSCVSRSFVRKSGRKVAKRYLEPREDDGADHSAILGEHLWPRDRSDLLGLVGEGWFDGAALERASRLAEIASAPAVLHGSPAPGQSGWDEMIDKLAGFRSLVVAVDPNSAGERLFRTLRDALSRYVPAIPLRFGTEDVASVAERAGDDSVASALLAVTCRSAA